MEIRRTVTKGIKGASKSYVDEKSKVFGRGSDQRLCHRRIDGSVSSSSNK